MKYANVALRLGMLLFLAAMTGCSSTGGLGLWSPTFPLLPQAKEFASSARLPNELPIEGCKTVLPNYFLEPGDELFIEPVEFDADITLPADQTILVDGTIDLGKYGRVIVTGLTVEQTESLIVERVYEIEGKRVPVNVRLLESNAAVVYVLGAVSSPGSYRLRGNETVLDGILLAGGLSSNASPCDIILSRPTSPCDCRVVLPICYRQITQMGDTTTNFQLQPGDRIYVGGRSLKEELFFWRQNQTCEKCCNSRCVARNPRDADYHNPICLLPAMPPLPFIKQSDADDASSSSDASSDEQSPTNRDPRLEKLPLEQLKVQ